MSKQQQAPGKLELVREYVNTADLERGEDQLQGGAGLAEWLSARGLAGGDLRVSRMELEYAIELREAIRALLLAHNGGPPAGAEARGRLDQAAHRARIRLRFDADASPSLEPEAAGVDGALGRLLTIIHAAIADGTWLRLKACREHSCEWAFYDNTKNRSGAWCNMQVCGNRAKARAYRERHAGDVA